jgi:hypothetical protein
VGYFRAMTTFSKKQLFQDWLARLPLVDLPVTLGEETHHSFTENTLPLAQALTDAFILPYEPDAAMDEFTEYIPCFRVEHTGTHHVCVYWRVSLMAYVYFLATFTPEGEQIDRTMLAGTFVDDEGKLAHRVAHLDADRKIICSEGRTNPEETEFDLSESIQIVMHISDQGTIVYETPSDR